MSLISDPDYIIHALRLNYLRSVEDPYGPRILSLSPNYDKNPHIVAAGLHDVERWPELAHPTSPKTTSDAWPLGARGLKHTSTIMGPNRTGLMGMRVNGSRRQSRASTQIRTSQLAAVNANVPSPTRTKRSDSEPLPAARAQAAAHVPADIDESTPVPPEPGIQRATSMKRRANTLAQDTAGPRIPPPEEMETRRRPQLRAHFSSPERRRETIIPNGEEDGMSSGDEDVDPDDMEDDELEEMLGDDVDDEFDPVPSSTSDNISLMSSNSLVAGSVVDRSLRDGVPRGRLSPVSEFQHPQHPKASNGRTPRRQASHQQLNVPQHTPPTAAPNLLQANTATPRTRSPSPAPPHPKPAAAPSLTFERVKVAPPPARSALTALLAAQNATDNPYTELYSLIAARSDAQGLKLTVFVHYRGAMQKLDVNVRKDATVEEVIGHALWVHWEEKREPKLDEGLPDDDEARKIRFSAVGWSLRIAEDDGEPDEDFPAPDRGRRIATFGKYFAVQLATPQQVKHHLELETKIQRRPSRIMVAKKREPAPAIVTPQAESSPAEAKPPSSSSLLLAPSSTVSTSMLNNMAGSVGASNEEILIKVHVANKTDDLAYVTVKVTPGTYMQEVLEQAARKRRWTDLNDAVLLTHDMKIVIPLDRTVASLQGDRHIVLARRSYFNQLGISGIRQFGRSSDPNASIFKRASEIPESKGSTLTDFTTAYKKYTVQRKLPILKRHERVLAIDGDYVHIMPSTTGRAFLLDNMKTSSYHVKSIVGVQVSKNSASGSSFRLVVLRETGQKQYDFEAENGRQAAEIVQSIKQLQKRYSSQTGAGAGNRSKARRSRAV
ncbi:hypothetical protein AURDEDRAFT_185578 [Auricularia subglabra TFB-10046 SS5]|nr:hypothetical protein AURDEDRAFT_185578 [Auricularia subglabra TFB-10046 SS5]